ncbi:MAG TPA: FISUMP domain-containing protein [Fibrobacteraceae bacterium]|nr:FISUMP domain-containing protein [Fibrobacteraceae bacterium]
MKKFLFPAMFLLSLSLLFLSCTGTDVATPDERWGSEVSSSAGTDSIVSSSSTDSSWSSEVLLSSVVVSSAALSSMTVSSSVEESSSSFKAVSSSVVASSSSKAVSSSVVVSSSSKAVSSSVVASSSSAISSSARCENTYSDSTVTDCRDGQSYKFVTIGTQIWLAQNLNYSGDDSLGNRTYTLGWCFDESVTDTSIHSDSSSCDDWGRFYNWTTAMDIDETYLSSAWGSADTVNHQGLCPIGWHLPTATEWQTLTDYVDLADDASDNSSEGTSLKSSDYLGTDLYGFAALLAGNRTNTGSWGGADSTFFWSATEHSSIYARYRYLSSSMTALRPSASFIKAYGFSLRCVMN